jgi:cytochrome c oxidase subunit 2
MQYSKIFSAALFLTSSLMVIPAFANSTPPQPGEVVIQVVAKQFDFTPGSDNPITLKKGQPVVLAVTTQDRKHGFFSEELGIDEVITPGQVNYIHLNPTQVGTFTFHCSVFCGSGHDGMQGTIIIQ